ncbi:MAG TPA: type II toxin-antitoxin system HicA family toxin [Armatimonadota bacterium]|nr:type II toxin-antitoxin system HicA family toxin [Armatimonadota bacterium]
MKTYTGKELVRVLEEGGWKVVRVEGSHHMLTKHGREEVISVPIHGSSDLKIGLTRHILKLAGIEKLP